MIKVTYLYVFNYNYPLKDKKKASGKYAMFSPCFSLAEISIPTDITVTLMGITDACFYFYTVYGANQANQASQLALAVNLAPI